MKGFLGLVFVLAFAVFAVVPAEAQVFGRNRVQVNVKGGAAVQVNAANGFRSRGAQVNVFNHAAVPIRGTSFGRINSFGSRTVVDSFGNVFEVNSFGQPVIRSSIFRGFGVNTFGAFAVPNRCF